MQTDNCQRDRRIEGVSGKIASSFVVSTSRRGARFRLLRYLILTVSGVWACFAGPLASAQTPTVLVSNLAQTRDLPQVDGDALAARENYILGIVFETGSSESGWLLSDLTLDVNRWSRGTTPTVSIYRTGLRGGNIVPVPTTRIATLDNPWPGMGWRTFSVPSRVQLKPNTFYAIVVESTATTAEEAFELRGTQSNDEDVGNLIGWDIDGITYVTADDTGWGEAASTLKVRFAAVGYDAGETNREAAKLESLTVTPIGGSLVRFTPSFNPGKKGPYTVGVTNDTTQVTLAAVAESSSARVDMPRDVNPDIDGTQINVPAGTTTRREIRVFDGPNDIFRTYYRLVFKHPGSMLTGTLEKLEPASSDGSLRYRFAVKLSAPVELSLAKWKSYVFNVANGVIVEAKRPVGQAVGPGGDPLSRNWHITVSPTDAAADTAITFSTKPGCTATGAVCTMGGLKLDSLPPLTFGSANLPTVSILDTSAQEDRGWMDFPVKLSRALKNFHVTYDFETIDTGSDKGTATPSVDYSTRPKYSMYFQTGQKKTKQTVRIIDDSVDDNGETVKVRISNAKLVDGDGNEVATLTITKPVATGTIRNADAMPKAWLARFGRTVAGQVIDAVESRMRAPHTPGAELSVAGQRIGGSPAPAPGEASDAEAGLKALSEWLRTDADEDYPGGFATRAVTGRDVLTGSSFVFTGGTPESGAGALWGRGAISRFDGREGNLSLDGDVVSALAGLDWTRGRTTAGLVVSHSRGDGGYRSSADDGTVESTLTGLYPWGRYALNERLSLWGVAGYGGGELVLTPKGKPPIKTDMDLAMAALGGRGVLVKAPAQGGLELAATSDAMAVRTTAEGVRGAAGSLAASEGDVTRVRLGLEGSWRALDMGGGMFVPTLEIGVRLDGGDAETGFGVDVGAGLAWADPARGVKAALHLRGLLTHREDGFREQGLAGTLAWDPDPASDRGPALSVSQTAGASASTGMEGLFLPESLRALDAANNDEDALRRRRLEAKLGYGFALFDGRYTGTPTFGLGLSDSAQETTLGWRLAEVRNAGLAFALDVEGARQERSAGDREPEHRLTFGLGWRLEGAQARGAALEVRFEGSRRVAANDDEGPEHRIGLQMTARW